MGGVGNCAKCAWHYRHDHCDADFESEIIPADLCGDAFDGLGDDCIPKDARQNYRKVRAAVSWANSVLAENVNGVRVVQAFSRQEHNYLNFQNYVNRYFYETSLDAAKVASVYTPVVDVLGAIATAMVVYVGGTAVLG